MLMSEEEMDEQLELEETLDELVSGINGDAPSSKVVEISSYGSDGLLKALVESGMAGPNKLDKKWPRVGEVFAVKFNDIKSASISRESKFDIGKFQWFISYGSLNQYDYNVRDLNHKIGDRYTILRYEGGREFTEFFTGTAVRLYEKNNDNIRDFMVEVNAVRENPLMVTMDDLVEVSDDIISTIISDKDELAGLYLNGLKESSIALFNNQFDIIWQEDYKDAIIKNKIDNFCKIKR